MRDDSEWQQALHDAGELTPSIVADILDTHGARGRRAIEGVGERRVKRYRDFTVVVGYHNEYIVEGGSCTCEDTRYNLDPTDPTDRCWHALAVDIADALGVIEDHDLWYSDVAELL
jgi:predicted nucleic acid-binding Zn finger protein